MLQMEYNGNLMISIWNHTKSIGNHMESIRNLTKSYAIHMICIGNKNEIITICRKCRRPAREGWGRSGGRAGSDWAAPPPSGATVFACRKWRTQKRYWSLFIPELYYPRSFLSPWKIPRGKFRIARGKFRIEIATVLCWANFSLKNHWFLIISVANL